MVGLETKYFVLKPRGDDVYAEASRAAMFRYSELIEKTDPELAYALSHWAFEEIRRARE